MGVIMGRIGAIDYGTRRIGLAIADPRGKIASPLGALTASGNAHKDADLILHWATENHVRELVVGLPLSMDGTDSEQTKLTRAVAAKLREDGTVTVELWDERLSSFQADLLLDSAGVPESRRKKLRDALAAQVVLQSYLDARQPR
jgi:putative Holliday junction resolvase